jgi:hypothetical protein
VICLRFLQNLQDLVGDLMWAAFDHDLENQVPSPARIVSTQTLSEKCF